jgi:hypothetical protein
VNPPAVHSIARLIKAGSLHAGGAFPELNYQSFPIPSPGPKGLRVAFLYVKAEVVEGEPGWQLAEPEYIGFVDAGSARFVELELFAPARCGIEPAGGAWLGGARSEAEWSEPEVLEHEARLYRAYDEVLPAFAAAETNVTREIRQAARAFIKEFDELAELPLLPYYHAIGSSFFSWLKRHA